MMQDEKKNKRFGKYLILDHLVDGGMAKIYRARYLGEEADRIVAIKMIKSQYSKDEAFKAMFMDEIKVTFSFQHPNIIQTYDYGVQNDKIFVAMEYCDGHNLKDYINKLQKQQKVFPIDIAIHIVGQACQGLHYAHKFTDKLKGKHANIIHRDISPHNIMLTFDGAVKVIDFGIAKADTNSEATKVGTIKGKISYLAPEYLVGTKLDHRYDQFAIGITLWEMLCGRKLFNAPNELATLKKVQDCKVPPPSSLNPKVPKELDEIILKALSRSRDDRFEDMDKLHRSLAKFLHSNYPEFHPSDISYFAENLFKKEIETDRKKLFEYGKINLKPYIEEWKSEQISNKEEGQEIEKMTSTELESLIKKEGESVFDFGFKNNSTHYKIEKSQMTAKEQQNPTKTSGPLEKLTLVKNDKVKKTAPSIPRPPTTEKKSPPPKKPNHFKKFALAMGIILATVYFGTGLIGSLPKKEETPQQKKTIQSIQDITETQEVSGKKSMKVTFENIDRYQQTIYVNGAKKKVDVFSSLELEGPGKVIIRVEQTGRKPFVTTLQLRPGEEETINIPDQPVESFVQLTTSPSCPKGALNFQLYGEKRAVRVPFFEGFISIPTNGDGRTPASDDGSTIYTMYFRKFQSKVQKKIIIEVSKDDKIIDLCKYLVPKKQHQQANGV